MLRFIFLVLIPVIPLNSQNTLSGLYLDSVNFIKQQISFSPESDRKYKLRVHQNNYNRPVVVRLGDSCWKFNKDSIFGYQDNEQRVYRFYHGFVYTIINPADETLIYFREQLGGNKGTQRIKMYYFSVSAGAPIFILNKHNLKQAFKHHARFADLLDLYFQSGENLFDVDIETKDYKLKRVINQSKL